MDYKKLITIESDKRGGRPCIRGMRITVDDVMGWLNATMSPADIVREYPELTLTDIIAAQLFADDQNNPPAPPPKLSASQYISKKITSLWFVSAIFLLFIVWLFIVSDIFTMDCYTPIPRKIAISIVAVLLPLTAALRRTSTGYAFAFVFIILTWWPIIALWILDRAGDIYKFGPISR